MKTAKGEEPTAYAIVEILQGAYKEAEVEMALSDLKSAGLGSNPQGSRCRRSARLTGKSTWELIKCVWPSICARQSGFWRALHSVPAPRNRLLALSAISLAVQYIQTSTCLAAPRDLAPRRPVSDTGLPTRSDCEEPSVAKYSSDSSRPRHPLLIRRLEAFAFGHFESGASPFRTAHVRPS
jgi:hypothetical protein